MSNELNNGTATPDAGITADTGICEVFEYTITLRYPKDQTQKLVFVSFTQIPSTRIVEQAKIAFHNGMVCIGSDVIERPMKLLISPSLLSQAFTKIK